jgi:hypothetical protein
MNKYVNKYIYEFIKKNIPKQVRYLSHTSYEVVERNLMNNHAVNYYLNNPQECITDSTKKINILRNYLYQLIYYSTHSISRSGYGYGYGYGYGSGSCSSSDPFLKYRHRDNIDYQKYLKLFEEETEDYVINEEEFSASYGDNLKDESNLHTVESFDYLYDEEEGDGDGNVDADPDPDPDPDSDPNLCVRSRFDQVEDSYDNYFTLDKTIDKKVIDLKNTYGLINVKSLESVPSSDGYLYKDILYSLVPQLLMDDKKYLLKAKLIYGKLYCAREYYLKALYIPDNCGIVQLMLTRNNELFIMNLNTRCLTLDHDAHEMKTLKTGKITGQTEINIDDVIYKRYEIANDFFHFDGSQLIEFVYDTSAHEYEHSYEYECKFDQYVFLEILNKKIE